MVRPPATAEQNAAEPVRFPALQVVDLAAEAVAVTEPDRNQVLLRLNPQLARPSPYWPATCTVHGPAGDELRRLDPPDGVDRAPMSAVTARSI